MFHRPANLLPAASNMTCDDPACRRQCKNDVGSVANKSTRPGLGASDDEPFVADVLALATVGGRAFGRTAGTSQPTAQVTKRTKLLVSF